MKVARTVLNGESGSNAADLHNEMIKTYTMKQKTITVNYRVRTTNEDIIESMIEEYGDNVEDIVALFAEAEDEGRIAVSYQYGDREVNAYFYDNEIWEGITQYSLEQIQQGMIYIPHPYITSMERNGNIVRVEMIVDMPWDKADAES